MRTLAILGAALASVGNAAAQSDNTGSVYARFGVGAAFNADLEQTLTPNPAALFLLPPPVARETQAGTGALVSAALGFQYTSNTRTELEYRYAAPSIDAVVETDALGNEFNLVEPGRFRTHFLMSNVYYDFRNASFLTPFIGAGVGGAFTSNGLGERDAAFAYQARAGLEAAISNANSFSVEYVYTRTRDLVYGPKEFGSDDGELFRADGDQLVVSSIIASFRRTF